MLSGKLLGNLELQMMKSKSLFNEQINIDNYWQPFLPGLDTRNEDMKSLNSVPPSSKNWAYPAL